MCNKIHEMLDKKLNEISINAKETMQNIMNLTLTIENIRGMLQNQIDMEASRWDRSDGRKGGS